MVFDPLNRAVNALGGLLFILLGLYVLSVDRDADKNRAFGLFAAAFGTHFLVGESSFLLGNPLGSYRPWVLSPLLALAAVGALWLAQALVSRMTDEGRRPLVAALGVGGVLFASHLAILSAYWGEIIRLTAAVLGDALGTRPGFLANYASFMGMLSSLFVVLYGLVLAYRPDVEKARRLEARLVTAALATYLGFVAGASFSEGTGISSGAEFSTWVTALNLVAVVGLAALWLDRSRRVPESKSARNVALYLLVMPLVGLLVQASGSYFGAYGVARTIAVVVLAYGILKHDLLGIDRKVRWGVSRTSVAGVFLAVFFVVSEGAQVLFAGFAGSEILGVLAAGALVFFLAPIQRAADELAEAVVPGTDGEGPGSAEDRYREVVRMALADGEITADEERRLADLAQRLGLGHRRVLELREQVEEEMEGDEP